MRIIMVLLVVMVRVLFVIPQQVIQHKDCVIWQGIYMNGCKMNITIITMEHLMMVVVGALLVVVLSLEISVAYIVAALGIVMLLR